MELSLENGGYALIDEEDYERVSRYKWSNMGKAIRCTTNIPHSRMLHHFILGTTTQIDHKNRDITDNRKENLRICTSSQNSANRDKFVGGSSRYKGVYKTVGRWRAQIRVNGKAKSLGRFDTEIEAAKAYDKAAKEQFGEFAKTNFA